jgi:uncharacterized protein YoxC
VGRPGSEPIAAGRSTGSISQAVLGFLFRPLAAIIRTLDQDAIKPLEETERQTLDAVRVIEEATQSIERHVEVVETLATSVGPLTESVDQLNVIMRDLVDVLAPIAGAEQEVRQAEHEIEQAGHLFRFRRHEEPGPPDVGSPDGS